MIIEKKGINGFSTNNNRRLHLKMQARGVKHNRTLYVLRQQRKGRGVTMVSTNNNKKSSWKQVRRSDQLRYPIHNCSFIAHGRLWMPCAPASTIKDKNQGYFLSEPAGSVSLEQTVTHTHMHMHLRSPANYSSKYTHVWLYDIFIIRGIRIWYRLGQQTQHTASNKTDFGLSGSHCSSCASGDFHPYDIIWV